jgi:hypothetical protein
MKSSIGQNVVIQRHRKAEESRFERSATLQGRPEVNRLLIEFLHESLAASDCLTCADHFHLEFVAQ